MPHAYFRRCRSLSVNTWQAKHPPCPPPVIPNFNPDPLKLSPDFDILSVLKTFPRGSGAGPSGLSAQHLEVINLMAAGKVPLPVSVYLAGGKLVALNKFREGQPTDVRPIAVGETLRRLTGRIWSQSGVQQGDPLGPMLFALVLHKLIHSIEADDGCIDISLEAWFIAERNAHSKVLLKMVTEVADIDLHVAFSLLCLCASFCKHVHLSRTTPASLCSDSLKFCDDEVRSCLSSCLAVDIPDPNWTQAQLSPTGSYLFQLSGVSQDAITIEAILDSHPPQSSLSKKVGYGLSKENINSRPADILVQSWDRGHPAAFNVTVTSPLTPAILNISSIYEGAAGRVVAEARRHTTNDAKCQDLGWLCIPLAVETYGNWGKEAHEAFNRLASLLAFGQTSHKSGLLLEIYSHVNMSLVRSIARAILGRALV
eukprot:Em0002g524a